jgi:putative transposase
VDARSSHLRRGWYWGTQAFGEAMRKLGSVLMRKASPKSRGYRTNPHVTEHGEKQAEIWLKAGLKAAGLKASDLVGLKGSDARKLMLAELLWRRTTVSQEWLAEKLAMKSAANVSQQLRRLDRKKVRASLPESLKSLLEQAEES